MKIDLLLLKRIHGLVAQGSTDSPARMAEKLGISKRFLHLMLVYLKEHFNAPIEYSRTKRTYYYSNEWDFYIGDLNKIKAELLNGVAEALHKTV